MTYADGVKLWANENFILRDIAGEKVLISVGQGVADFRGYIQMNESAAFLWSKLREGITAGELRQAFTDRYQISPQQAQGDIQEVLDRLRERGMIRCEEC